MRLRYDMAMYSKNIIPQKNIASWYSILTCNSYFLERTVNSVRKMNAVHGQRGITLIS